MRQRFLKPQASVYRYVCEPPEFRVKLTQENGCYLLELGVGDKAQGELVLSGGSPPNETLWQALTELTSRPSYQPKLGVQAVLLALTQVRNQLGLLVWERGQPRPDNRW